MRRRKYISALLLSLSLVLTACSKGGQSSTALDEMSRVSEQNGGSVNEAAILPEAVSFDSDRVTELAADGAGILKCDEMGVSFELPSQYKAYFYSIGDVMGEEWQKTVNPSCTHSLFVVSPYYPQVSEYVRVSVDRLIAAEVIPLNVLQRNEPSLTEAEYLRRVKSDIELYTDIFEAYENADMYNYIGAKKNDGYPAGSSYFREGDYGTVSLTSTTTPREPAPDSEISEIKSEPVELDNGNFGLRFDYTLTRNGVKTEKEVYWLYSAGEQLLRRVEFTKDGVAGTSLDTKKFLETMEFFFPSFPEGNQLYGFSEIWEEPDPVPEK